jgi:putative tryptophan/tyrosine transport system permease protein
VNLEITDIVLHIIQQGLIYSLVVFGVHISSRVIRFDDLTTEGSFGLGGAITAVLIVSGVPATLALVLAMAGGALAGIATGLLHTKMNMNNLISGLVTTTGLFSICLKLAKSNLPLPPHCSIFDMFGFSNSPGFSIAVLAIVVATAFIGVKILLQSEIGLILRALGSNEQILVTLGKNVDNYKILGLAISNSLTGLAGSLFVQWSGFFSITGNVGTLVIGLAGLILAEMIKSKFGLSLLLGAILYQAIFAITIECELQPIWNNFIKAVLIVAFVQLKPRKAILQRYPC